MGCLPRSAWFKVGSSTPYLEFYVVCATERIPPLSFSIFNCGKKYFMDFLFTLIDPVAALDSSNPPVRYVVVILKGSDQFASNFFVLLSFSFLIKRMSIDLENQTWSPLSNFFLLSVSGRPRFNFSLISLFKNL